MPPLLKTLSGTEISFHTFNAFIVYRYKRGLRPRNIGFPLRCVCQCDNVARTRSSLKMLPLKSEISIFYCDNIIARQPLPQNFSNFACAPKKMFEILRFSSFQHKKTAAPPLRLIWRRTCLYLFIQL